MTAINTLAVRSSLGLRATLCVDVYVVCTLLITEFKEDYWFGWWKKLVIRV